MTERTQIQTWKMKWAVKTAETEHAVTYMVSAKKGTPIAEVQAFSHTLLTESEDYAEHKVSPDDVTFVGMRLVATSALL
jgi:hypothetical protein